MPEVAAQVVAILIVAPLSFLAQRSWVLEGQGHAARRHRRGLQDRRRRLPVDREAVDDLLEVLDVADVGAHHVAVLARHARSHWTTSGVSPRASATLRSSRGAGRMRMIDAERVGRARAGRLGAVARITPSSSSRASRSATAGSDRPTRRPSSASDSRASGLQLGDQEEVGVIQGGSAFAVRPMFRRHTAEHTCEMPCEGANRGIVSGMRTASPAPRLLRRQRDLPLPRPGLRRPPVRPRRGPRRRVAADRLRRARLRAVAAPVARVRRARPPRPPARAGLGRRAGAHELLLLRRDRPAAARHGRRDRVPARDRARRARRPHDAATPPRSCWPSAASTC